MLGYGPHEFPNEIDELWRHVAPDDVDRVMTAINDHLSGRTDQYACEFRLRKKDGTFCWVLAKGKATQDMSGHRFAGSHTEITESKKNEKFYHAVLDAINSLIFVKDGELRFTFVNSATARAFGRSRESLIGCTDRGINGQLQQVTLFEHDDRHVLETEQHLIISHEQLTFADNSTHDLATVKIPLRLGPSDDLHVLGVATDITELCKQSRLTAKLLNVLLEAVEEIEAAPTEAEACQLALLQLERLDYPECMISFLHYENGQYFVIADAQYASSEKWQDCFAHTTIIRPQV